MKNKHFLKAAAFVLAAAFVCTSSSVTAWNIKKDISDNNNSNNKETVQPIAAEIVPEEERWSVKEQLTYASKGNDDTKLTLICNNLIDELNETKKSIDAESAEIAQWADGEILERQKQYEKTINEKYTQTIQALNNVKNGIDTDANIDIISDNLSSDNEISCAYAAPRTVADTSVIETIDEAAIRVQASSAPSYDPTEKDLDMTNDIFDANAFRQIADELGDFDEIYRFIKNNIKNEMYTGSKKGPLLTFYQLGGNDIDQASLLVYLLRSKNIPARFVRGTVRITTQQALDLTGASDAETASRIIAVCYKNSQKIMGNEGIKGFRFEHTWAEAYIPYTDYRGAGSKSGESVWIPLDPSFKKIVMKEETLDAKYNQEQIDQFRGMQEMIKESPDMYKDDIVLPDKINLRYPVISNRNEIYLPSSLPYTVDTVSERYTAIKSADKQTISIGFNDETIFSSPVAELYGQYISIAYEPASESDKEVMDRYEKFTSVPAYLVRVVPVVTVGTKRYAAEESCTLGTVQQMSTRIKDDTGTTVLYDQVLAGSVYAINLDLNVFSTIEGELAEYQMKAAAEKRGTEKLFTADVLGEVIGYAGRYYFSLCDFQDQLYAGTNNILYSRHLGAAITGYQFHTSTAFGTVRSLDPGNFYIDASYNKSTAINLDGDTSIERKYNFETGLIESRFEGDIWAELTGSDQPRISTVHVMTAAAEKGIEPVYLTAANANAVLDDCNIDSYIKTDIKGFANSGNLIILVPEILSMGDWVGTAYIAMDPVTGAALYMISDGTAGGASQDYDLEVEPDINDKLFNLNIKLSYINRALALAGVVKGCAGLIKAEEGDIKSVVENLIGMFASTCAYANAVQMELNMCDLVLEYAEEGMTEQELRNRLGKEAAKNLAATAANILALVNVNTSGSNIGGEIGNIMTTMVGLAGSDDNSEMDMGKLVDTFLHLENLAKLLIGI